MKRSRKLVAAVCLTVGVGLAGSWAWFGRVDGLASLNATERKYARLSREYSDRQNAYWHAARGYETAEAREAAEATGELVDPDCDYLPKLLEFEATHRGEDVGLNALNRVFGEAGRGGHPDSPRFAAAREASLRLRHYATSPLLTRVVRDACSYALHPEPQVAAEVEALLRIPDVPPRSRDLIRLYLAERALEINRYLPGWTEELAKLESGEMKPPWPGALEHVRRVVDGLPSVETVASEADAALDALRQLAADEDSPRVWKKEAVDARGRLFRMVEDPEGRRIADLASALLFKEERLVRGAIAPELVVELLGGETWRLDDHRGKVVVIQFSFTGCAPCARMYPDLADLTAEYGDRLEVLTLMRDATAEHAERGVADGKLTWSIAIDGNPGEVATRWSVQGFPEVYVVGGDGRISAVGPRGQDLRNEIEQLALSL